jgi:hypothetical protein
MSVYKIVDGKEIPLTQEEISFGIEQNKKAMAKVFKEDCKRIREERDQLLLKCDWTQLPKSPVDAAAWEEYRQALRDVPAQDGFPNDVVWPEKP